MKKDITLLIVFVVSTIFINTSTYAQETGTMTDSRDGHVYKTVKIGNQWWMAENLKYKPSSGKYWPYENNKSYISTYGYLYDWETACYSCPKGWHLPSKGEWGQLGAYLGGRLVGGELKESGTTHWNSPNKGANNSSRFSVLPSGIYSNEDGIEYVGQYTYFWSSTETRLTSEKEGNYLSAKCLQLGFIHASLLLKNLSKELRFSIRCIKD